MKKVIGRGLMVLGALYLLELVPAIAILIARRKATPKLAPGAFNQERKVTQLGFNQKLEHGDPGKLETDETFKGWSIGGYL